MGGTWAVETLDGLSPEESIIEAAGVDGVDLDITTNEWTFDSDGTMEWTTGVECEAKEEDLTISAEGSITITGTYTLSGSNYTLVPIAVGGTGVFEGRRQRNGHMVQRREYPYTKQRQ